MRAIRSLAVASSIATALLIAVTIEAQDSEYEQLLVRYRQDVSTDAGLKYEHHWTARYQSIAGSLLGTCIHSTGRAESFEVIFILDKDGHVTGGVPKVASPLVACLVEALQKDTFPAPPFAPFHEHLVQHIS